VIFQKPTFAQKILTLKINGGNEGEAIFLVRKQFHKGIFYLLSNKQSDRLTDTICGRLWYSENQI
jgi:hypothetical protein